jgi:hypothetical protein
MSDEEVRAAVEQMEAWLADPAWGAEPDELSRWNAGFQSAMARAEKGPGWPDLSARAHRLGRDLEVRLARLVQLQHEVKAELNGLQRGDRALKGYGNSTR